MSDVLVDPALTLCVVIDAAVLVGTDAIQRLTHTSSDMLHGRLRLWLAGVHGNGGAHCVSQRGIGSGATKAGAAYIH